LEHRDFRHIARKTPKLPALLAIVLFPVELGYHTFPVQFTELKGNGNDLAGQSYWPVNLSPIITASVVVRTKP
jgi:hypothetical protein